MKNEEKMTKSEIIKAVIQTLNSIPIAGYENHNKMMGVFMLLQNLAEEGEGDGTMSDNK